MIWELWKGQVNNMTLGSVTGYSPYGSYYPSYGMTPADALRPGTTGLEGANRPGTVQGTSEAEKAGKINGNEKCETCENRKYQDGSDEMVSYKGATHISPESATSAVRAHEQEHVANAYQKAATKDGKVIKAAVTIHTSICPECGRSYVSGGTTSTQIKYSNEENPYQKELKAADKAKYTGMHADYAV